ncbi:MAG: two-component system response regulator [SAR86 cluster bacterium]|uniref:Two-component system response regulator n=1 Tax=SAR86 cluster bacterium TaxID=2030880 RepID=A0A2A5CI79_9GAMM|nr:MAG: two-component system response regulator [SAR86 cluster bacterium]
MTLSVKILLVDDEIGLLESGRKLLELSGYDVSTAQNGKQAIDALKAHEFDLAILDLNMPGVGGHEVMKFINEEEINTTVIVISGETGFDAVSQAFYLGAFDFLQKPYEYDALINTIQNALNKQALEKSFLNLRKKLERSEKLHRFMVESSPDIIFIVDKQGRFVFANNRAEEVLGYSKDELIGEHYSHIVEPACLEQASHCFLERREGARATREEEIWLTCKPGKHFDSSKDKIAIELNSVGVYEHESVDDAGKHFSGTYIVARDITERLSSEKLIHYQAYHDLLTGLPNRALFLDRLSTAISNAKRDDHSLAVMFLDLDRFKVANDSLGHSIGDELLKRVGERLDACLREGDSLARLGGDEFIVLLPHMPSEADVHAVGNKIVETIKQPFKVEGHELYLTVSVGISMYPRDGDNAETLIKHSDVAMYHTKEQGKNNYHLYEDNMSVKNNLLLSIENEIRKGIKENQFEVFYQPQVDLNTGEVCGVEALLRWNHPTQGLLSPSHFLSIAEDSGLICELGDWVLEEVLAEMKTWQEEGLKVNKFSVNFSGKEIEQKDFVDKIIKALKKYRTPKNSLEIEVTENILMRDIDSSIEKLRQLHDVGVSIAIDDFGTGYSSLSLLQKLPINRLKIDRSFIQDMEQGSDRSIIEAIAHMAKGLKLEMIAEGVEQEYQLRYLRQLKCPIVQGYIFSQGVPSDEAKKFVRDTEEMIKQQKIKA